MHSFAWWPTLAVLIAATFTDLRNRRIPNWLVFPFLLVGVAVSPWRQDWPSIGRNMGWHGIGQSFAGFGVGLLVCGIFFLVGWHGRRRCEVVCRHRRVDWTQPVGFGTRRHRLGRRNHGSDLGGQWRVSRGIVCEYGRSPLRMEGAGNEARSGDGSVESAEAQDAVRSGDCCWNTVFIFCPVRL